MVVAMVSGGFAMNPSRAEAAAMPNCDSFLTPTPSDLDRQITKQSFDQYIPAARDAYDHHQTMPTPKVACLDNKGNERNVEADFAVSINPDGTKHLTRHFKMLEADVTHHEVVHNTVTTTRQEPPRYVYQPAPVVHYAPVSHGWSAGEIATAAVLGTVAVGGVGYFAAKALRNDGAEAALAAKNARDAEQQAAYDAGRRAEAANRPAAPAPQGALNARGAVDMSASGIPGASGMAHPVGEIHPDKIAPNAYRFQQGGNTYVTNYNRDTGIYDILLVNALLNPFHPFYPYYAGYPMYWGTGGMLYSPYYMGAGGVVVMDNSVVVSGGAPVFASQEVVSGYAATNTVNTVSSINRTNSMPAVNGRTNNLGQVDQGASGGGVNLGQVDQAPAAAPNTGRWNTAQADPAPQVNTGRWNTPVADPAPNTGSSGGGWTNTSSSNSGSSGGGWTNTSSSNSGSSGGSNFGGGGSNTSAIILGVGLGGAAAATEIQSGS